MPKSLFEVQQEYDQYKSQNPDSPVDLPSFAKQMDQVTGTPDRQAGYDPHWYNKASAGIDTGLAKTHLPEFGRFVGEGLGGLVDQSLGTHVAPTLGSVGEATPRMIGEGVLTTLAPEAEAPLLMSRLARLGQAVGYGSAALRGYDETGSPLGAAISAGSMYGANKLLMPAEAGGLDVGGRVHSAAERFLAPKLEEGADLAPSTLAERYLPKLAGIGADVGALTGVNEVTRQAQMSVGPNAVGLTDSARNPFTQENIAGDVAGAAFFTPQIISSLRGGPHVSPGQVKQLHDFLTTKENALREVQGDVPVEQPDGGVTSPDETLRSRHEALYGIIRSSLDAADQFDQIGKSDDAERARTNALAAIDEAAGGRYSPMPDDLIGHIKTAVDEQARMQPAPDSAGFADFVAQVKGNIDMLNEGRMNYESELQQREDAVDSQPRGSANRKAAEAELATWKASMQANIGKSWHPQARASEAVDGLWKSGTLPPLTPKWLESEFQASFDASGNPQFASRVVQQKVANYYLDRADAAIATRNATSKADPTLGVAPEKAIVKKYNDLDMRFAQALAQLPPEVHEAVVKRTIELRRDEVTKPWGEVQSRYAPWQDAVIRAAATYDPATGTSLIPFRNKGDQRSTIDTLVRKGEGGKYVWEPNQRPLPSALGGKPSTGTEIDPVTGKPKKLYEGNIEAVPTKEGQESVGATDEEAFKGELAQSTQEPVKSGDFGSIHLEGEKTPNVDMPTEPTMSEAAVGEKMSKVGKQLNASLDSLTDQQAWNLAKSEFKLRSSMIESPKAQNFKLALRAALETLKAKDTDPIGPSAKAFRDVEVAGGKVPLAGASEVRQTKQFLRKFFQADVGNYEERIAKVVRKLVDPEAVKRAKTELKMQGDEVPGTKSPDRVEYERLQSEMKRMGYDKAGTPEFNDLWQKSEDIKNRNGGMPPSESAGPKQQSNVSTFGSSDGAVNYARELGLPERLVEQNAEGRWYVKDSNTARPVSKVEPGTIVNEPRAGSFVPDVERTMRAWVDKTLGRAGYSGSTREFLTEVAVALAKQMPDLDLYRLVGKEAGVAGSATEGSPRGKLGLNIDKETRAGEEFKAAQQLLQTLSHEITHMDGYIRDGLIPRPDAYSDERARVYANMQHLAANLNDDERAAMLKVMDESVPEQFRTSFRQEDGRPYGTSNPDEFVAEMTSKTIMMLANDTKGGRLAAREALEYGPEELRQLAQNTFRTIGDTLDAMKLAADKGKIYTKNTDPFILSKGFEVILDSAHVMSNMREAEATLALARNTVANLSSPTGFRPPVRMTDAVWFRGGKDVEKYQKNVPVPSQTTIDAINHVQDEVFSPKAYDAKHTPNAFARWFYPFSNLMTNMERQGVTLARPIFDTISSLEPGISRLYLSMMSGFLKQNTDGSFDFNADHPLVKKVSEEKSGPWRDAVNKVSAWQQNNKTQSMFVVDEKGNITVNPDPKLKAQAKWDSISSQLSRDNQQAVMGVSAALDKSNQLAAGHLVAHLQESNVGHVATYIMAANKKMQYDTALAIAQKVHDAYLNGQVLSLNGTLPPDQLMGVQRLLVGTQTKEAPMGDGLLAKFVDVKNLLENRPGFRSESLPHDWIVKYSDNGSIKFDSRPTEAQAKYLANRLTASGKQIMGEIVNKKDLRTTDFDSPDALLAKVAENEDFVWQKFIADMEQQHGTDIATSLREGYTPVAQSIQQMGVNGLNKFLKERRALVDRESYDYIDGTMGYLQRMSAGLAIRGMQQQVRLILNDPRARFLPTFQKMVREHVAEMMQPQSDLGRKMKAFTSTYFIGANLASSAVNATQSISTLVPWLMNGVDPRYTTKGGPAKAWKDMFVAMGTATDYTLNKAWQQTAAMAKGLDPKTLTLDQSLASNYRRHIENGGIQQTVIDDLVYGRDQRMLMNAKFGHGDYGPVPVSKMITDKLYLGSQLMLSLYKGVEHFNAKTAFLAGTRQGFELGLRGDELYQYATKMQSLATFGGGRANAPGLVPKLSTQYTRSAVGLANSLQQYGYGMVATYAQLAKDSLGRSSGLNAAQVRQAQKAFGTMLMTQTAIAGALGLPFVGASLTLLEKVFGIPANQAVRQGLASLGGDDDETGAAIAETALNGFANQALGLDVSSRLGTSTLLGTSSYRGFSLQDMLGPVPSIVGNAVSALNLFGQGRPAEAFHDLVPAAFKNAVELSDTKAKYGDYGLRDKAGNLMYTPTDGRALGYALGFRPQELSQRRAMQSMLTAADERTGVRRDVVLDRAAESLSQGDPSQAQRLATDSRAVDPTLNPRDILRQVMDRSVAMQSEKDMLASGSRYNEGERLDIAKTFGGDVNPRRSELDIQGLRMQLASSLGDPGLFPTSASMEQAVLIDHFVKEQGMPRSQAVRLVSFLSGGPPGVK